MLIHDMSRQASIELLLRTRLGRLACARDGQPYITPIHFAYDANCLYSFSTLGQKIAWMRANPLVCLEADEIKTPDDWATVIVLGKYEELPNTPEYEAPRMHAYNLLQQRALWWEPGYVKTVLEGKTRPLELMYFRIHIDRINGHRGLPDASAGREFSAARGRRASWLQKILGRVNHQKTGG